MTKPTKQSPVQKKEEFDEKDARLQANHDLLLGVQQLNHWRKWNP